MHRRASSRGVPLLAGSSRPGRSGLPSLVRPPAALMGSCPSQVCSRIRVDAPRKRGGQTSAASLPVRAHLSFVPRRPTRFVFVGVKGPPSYCVSRSKKGELFGDDSASTSGLGSRLRSNPPAYLRPTDRSCLGLSLFQDFGHDAVQPSGLDPDRITGPRGVSRPRNER
jgi:hypothetical protein